MKWNLLIVVICAMAPILVVVAMPFWSLHGGYMNTNKVCQRWGDLPLDIEEFRAADENERSRAEMACSLLGQQDRFIGMHRLEILELFGDSNGYYGTEMTPTYLIETARSRDQDSWQIVFLINKDRLIRRIVVHKNCC